MKWIPSSNLTMMSELPSYACALLMEKHNCVKIIIRQTVAMWGIKHIPLALHKSSVDS